MKQITIIFLILTLLSCASTQQKQDRLQSEDWRWHDDYILTIQGVPVGDVLAGASPWTVIEFFAGSLAALLTHEFLGHVAYLRTHGIDYNVGFRNGSFWVGFDESEADMRIMGNNGYAAQTLLGLALSYSPWRERVFTRGVLTFNVLEISTYPMRHPETGDLANIDAGGGNPVLAFYGYGGINVLLLKRNLK